MDMWNLIEATSTEFFYDRLEAIGLHRGQPKMLRFLGENDGCRQKDIADRFFLRAASVSGVLNTLEKQGLIERRQNPKSRRETLIYLTDQEKKNWCRCGNSMRISISSGLRISWMRNMRIL